MELAHQLSRPNGPYAKSQVARALEVGRATLYWPSVQAVKDKQVAVAILEWHEIDDTLGHRKLAALLCMGKERVRRVMHKYSIVARRKRKKYGYPGKATVLAPNLVRQPEPDSAFEVVFSDIFEVKTADGHKMCGCFVLWKQTQQVLALAFAYSKSATLVGATVHMLYFAAPDAILHSDQGELWRAIPTRAALEKGFWLSMSRAGTPTDNGFAERFVGLFKLAVAERRPYQTLGDFICVAEQWVLFYETTRPHQSKRLWRKAFGPP